MDVNYSTKRIGIVFSALMLLVGAHPLAATESSLVVADDRESQPKVEATPAQGTLVFAEPADVLAEPAATPVPELRRLPPADKIEQVAHRAPTRQSRSTGVEVAHHREAKMLPTADTDSIVEQLLKAHELSLQATTEAEFTEIITLCTDAVRLDTNSEQGRFARQLSAWALNRRGKLRSDTGEAVSADADFRAALDYNPLNWRAIHNRGVSYAQSGQFAEAFDDFNHVIELNPRFAKAFANRATLYVQANDLQAALDDYREAAKIDENLLTAAMGLGRVYHMMGRWDKAIEHYGKAAQMAPANPDIVCSRGDLLADMGRYREALADYARTIEIDPAYAHAYRNGAWLLATCPNPEFRDEENALLGAQQAIEFEYGEQHVALDTLAAALANAGMFEDAVHTVEQAISLAPAETKIAYLSRLHLYQQQQPYRSEPTTGVSQTAYQVVD